MSASKSARPIAVIGAGSPASPPPTTWRNAAVASPSSTAIPMRRWRPPSPMAASSRPRTPKCGTAGHGAEGAEVDAVARRPAAGEPVAVLAQASWMGEFIAAIPRYEDNTVDHRPAGDRGARASAPHGGARKASTSIWRIAASCISMIEKDFEAAGGSTPCWPKGGLDRRAVTPEEIRRSSRRCGAPIMAASSRRPIAPATSTSSPTAWPVPANGGASSCASTPRSFDRMQAPMA